MQLFKKSMPLSKRKLLWEIKLKREEVCRNVLSRLNLGCHPRVSDPSSLCQREEVHKLPVSRVSFPGNVEPVRYEHSQNLSSPSAPYDQDTQQNTRPPLMPFEVKPFQRSFLPRGPSLFFILKGLCHEPSSSVIIPVIATHDGFSNWRINLSEKMDDGQFWSQTCRRSSGVTAVAASSHDPQTWLDTACNVFPKMRGKALKGNPLNWGSSDPSEASKCSLPDGVRFLAD